VKQTLSDQQLEELKIQLGRLNGKFTRDSMSEYTGGSIEGLMITDPNYGKTSYQARFPCLTTHSRRRGLLRRERYEVTIDVHHCSVLETSHMAAIGIGCPSANYLNVFLPQYPNGPQQFAQALQSITRIKINWHFVEVELDESKRNYDYYDNLHLQRPANNAANPPELLVHQDNLVQLERGGETVFGTGQAINAPAAVLVSMYQPYVRVPVSVQGAQAMDGWFHYHVVKAA
jgi:hypothetical protein